MAFCLPGIPLLQQFSSPSLRFQGLVQEGTRLKPGCLPNDSGQQTDRNHCPYHLRFLYIFSIYLLYMIIYVYVHMSLGPL
jgi:hypothetical protein